MEEFDFPADSNGFHGSIAAFQETNRDESAAKPTEETCNFPIMVSEADYPQASLEMCSANAEMSGLSTVNKMLKEKGLSPEHGAFRGAVTEESALVLYKDLEGWLDADKEAIVVHAGKHLQEFVGFDGYQNHLGAHIQGEQRKVTAGINGKYMNGTSLEKEWNSLYNVVKQVKEFVGNGFKLAYAHVLFFKNKHVNFTYHCDANEANTGRHPGHKADLSIVMEVSRSFSTMHVAGEDASLKFDAPGTFFAFDSKLFHRSGVSRTNTVKIGFFFQEEEKKAKKSDESKNSEAGGSGEKKKPGEEATVEEEPEDKKETVEIEEVDATENTASASTEVPPEPPVTVKTEIKKEKESPKEPRPKRAKR